MSFHRLPIIANLEDQALSCILYMHVVRSMQTIQLRVIAMADCALASGQERGCDNEMTATLTFLGAGQSFPACKVEQRLA